MGRDLLATAALLSAILEKENFCGWKCAEDFHDRCWTGVTLSQDHRLDLRVIVLVEHCSMIKLVQYKQMHMSALWHSYNGE